MHGLGTLLLFTVSIGLTSTPVFATDIVRYAKKRSVNFDASEYEVKSYYLSLLKKALEITKEEYGSYQLVPSNSVIRGKRAIESLKKNKSIDITWFVAQQSLEKGLRFIDVPLLRGKSGYKLLMIRKEDQAHLESIDSVGQLKQLKAGVISDSLLAKLMKKNNLSTISATHRHKILHSMLKAKRFDYFPLEVYGAYLYEDEEPNIIPMPNIALYHPQHFYYHINQDNQRLHDRVMLGLNKLEQSGQFEAHFNSHPMTAMYQKFEPAHYQVIQRLK